MDVRVDERGCKHKALGFDDAMAVHGQPGSELRDDPAVHADVEDGVDALDRVDDARAANDETVLGSISREERHATSSMASVFTSTGPWVNRSYSTAMRTTSPLR